MMETVWIVGAGNFGLHALKKLSRQQKKREFVLIDKLEVNIGQELRSNCTFKQTDGVTFLIHNLKPGYGPDWIIPTLPLHLAAEWCLHHLEQKGFRRELSLPADVDPLLPNPMRVATGDIYVSHATFRCPDNCPESRDKCTVTQAVRPQNMFELLKHMKVPLFQSLVIRSHQLAPGVGGYRTEQLFYLLHQAKTAKRSLLISTACRCHGVITGLSR